MLFFSIGDFLRCLLTFELFFNFCHVNSVQVKDSEALGFATIFRKALLYHPPSKNLPPNLVSSLLQHMFNLTITFCEASVREENVSIFEIFYCHSWQSVIIEFCFNFQNGSEDSTYNEALEKILEAWLLILQGKEVNFGTILTSNDPNFVAL